MDANENRQKPKAQMTNRNLARVNRELAVLNRIVMAATSAQDPTELLTVVCRELAHVFDSPQAGAALLNDEGTSLKVVAEYLALGRPSSLGHVIPVEGNLATQYVLDNQKPLPINDVLNDPRMAAVRHLMTERGTLSMLILPLLAQDEVIGTIGLDLINQHTFSDEEVRLAFNAAKSSAQSLANARMFGKMQDTLAQLEELTKSQQQAKEEQSRRNQELALLNRIITTTSSENDPKKLLSIVCRELAQIFNSPQAGAALLDDEHASLTVVAEYLSEGRPSSLGHVIPVEGNLATQYVLNNQKPLPINDVLNDPRMAAVHHLMAERGTLAMLILPLLDRDRVIGTIGLDLIERYEFNEQEVNLAFNAAKSTAQSLANARMFDQIQSALDELRQLSVSEKLAKEEQVRRNKELALLNRIITATNSAKDPTELLTIACKELAQIFNSPQAGAALLNEEQTSLTVIAEYLGQGRPSSLGHVIPIAGNLATQHVLKHRQPLPINDVLNDLRMASVHHLMEERGTLSMLILPLLARDEVIGTIGLDLIEPHEFTDDEVSLAFNAATSTAQSLANARMFDQIQITLAELQRVEEARHSAERDELNRYLPEAIREKIEQSYYAKVNEQAKLDHAVRNRDFVEDPLNHVALFSDHGVVHVRDVARNIVTILDTINGVLIPHRNRLWLDFMKGYGVMLAYNHDIGMMDFSAFGRAMHPEFAAQAVYKPEYDDIVDMFWDENWGNVSWRLIKLAEHGALQGDLKLILREMLAMSIGHSKSKVSVDVLNDVETLREVMLKSISTDLHHHFYQQQLKKAAKRLAEAQANGVKEVVAGLSAELVDVHQSYDEYAQQERDPRNKNIDIFYADFEKDAFTWLVSDHPAMQALTRDVVDTLRALRVADALRQRGTTLKTSGGYQIFVDHNTGNAVIALQKSSGEMMMFEVKKTHSIGEANIASSEITLGGDLRISLHHGSFRTEAATNHAAYCCAVIIDDIQRDVLDSFWRPVQPSTQRKRSDEIQILIEETDDSIHFAELVLAALSKINSELVRRSRIVPSLKNISSEERQRYLTASELNWSLEKRLDIINHVAHSGHKTQRIDPQTAFTDVRLIELRQGEILIDSGSPPGFVYVPLGDGLQSLPMGGYQAQEVRPWIPLGNTRVIRGDVQEARVTAEKNIQLLMIPKEIYLKFWHDTYNLGEFAPALDLLFSQDEHHRLRETLNILKQVAMIDGVIEESEILFIQNFVESIDETYATDSFRDELLAAKRTDIAKLRQDAIDFLSLSPPYQQVARLRDSINMLAGSSTLDSSSRSLVLIELNGMLDEYLNQDTTVIPYQVVVVPQSDEQDEAIRALLPTASRVETNFGFAYLGDTFHSREYAEMIANRYRSLRLFALVVHGANQISEEVNQQEELEFTPAEREMYANFIHRLTPVEFKKLLREGRWQEVEADHYLVHAGDIIDWILFISNGAAVVLAQNEILHNIEAGSFVGEMEFLTGGPAIATVKTKTPMTYIIWQKGDLELLLSRNPEMHTILQTMFSVDVVKKINLGANTRAASN